MNPEIRAVFLGLVIAALSWAVILALFYKPEGAIDGTF
jgi:hypothetical protein